MTSPVDGKHACPRCGTLVGVDSGLDLADFTPEILEGARHEMRVAATPELPDFKPLKPPRGEPSRTTSLRWEAANWELNEKLRHVERVTATSRRRFDEAAPTVAKPHYGPTEFMTVRPPSADAEPPSFAPPPSRPYAPPPYAPQYPSPHSPDGPQDPYSPITAPSPAPHEWNEYEDDDAPRPGQRAAMLVSWVFLGLATTAFSCGGFLVAWGAVAERPPLQQLGMPILLAGVLALVVGVLPQVMLRSLEEERRRREATTHTARQQPHSIAAPHFGHAPAVQRRRAA